MRQAHRVGMVAVAAILAAAIPPAYVWSRGSASRPVAPAAAKLVADFGAEQVSPDARRLVEWVASTRDHRGTAFAVIDKKLARLYVFDPTARLRGSSPVLIGSQPGDDSAPGVGLREVLEVPQQERTTPAGRYDAVRGRNMREEEVVWVNYSERLSMHPVLTTNPREHRLERLETPSVADNRISYGCINVPADFYYSRVDPAFARGAVVYILPEQKSLEEVFGPKV